MPDGSMRAAVQALRDAYGRERDAAEAEVHLADLPSLPARERLAMWRRVVRDLDGLILTVRDNSGQDRTGTERSGTAAAR